MRRLFQFTLVLSAFVAFANCSSVIKGEFGFSASDRREMGPIEKSLLLETEFQLGRENLFFYDNQTIWWIYRIEEGPYKSGEFLVSLYENNLTPEPVEVDLRHVEVERQSGFGIIRQVYEPLRPGDYILRIAQHAHAVDEAKFRVLESEESNVESDQAETDEILRHSKRIDS